MPLAYPLARSNVTPPMYILTPIIKKIRGILFEKRGQSKNSMKSILKGLILRRNLLQKSMKSNFVILSEFLTCFYSYLEWIKDKDNLEIKESQKSQKEHRILSLVTQKYHKKTEFHQNARFIKLFLKYAGKCQDEEQVLLFMKENDIGTQQFIFYKALSFVLEKKRDFIQAQSVLNEALGREIEPKRKVESLMQEFEMRMLQRLDRDFYSKGYNLISCDTSKSTWNDISGWNFTSQKRKRQSVLDEFQNPDNQQRQKIKLNKYQSKQVDYGGLKIFIDKSQREQILPQSKIYVDQYQQLEKQFPQEQKKIVDISKKQMSWVNKINKKDILPVKESLIALKSLDNIEIKKRKGKEKVEMEVKKFLFEDEIKNDYFKEEYSFRTPEHYEKSPEENSQNCEKIIKNLDFQNTPILSQRKKCIIQPKTPRFLTQLLAEESLSQSSLELARETELVPGIEKESFLNNNLLDESILRDDSNVEIDVIQSIVMPFFSQESQYNEILLENSNNNSLFDIDSPDLSFRVRSDDRNQVNQTNLLDFNSHDF